MGVRVAVLSRPVPEPAGGRGYSRFKAGWESTSKMLVDELERIGASDVVLEMDIGRQDVRVDGSVRGTATPRTPGVRLGIGDSAHGSLEFEGNAYHDWRDNVRAIALTLEALRAVCRYGCVQAQQYRGFAALPPGENADVAAMAFRQVVVELAAIARGEWVNVAPNLTATPLDAELRRRLAAAAILKAHPDHGGTSALLARATALRERLRQLA